MRKVRGELTKPIVGVLVACEELSDEQHLGVGAERGVHAETTTHADGRAVTVQLRHLHHLRHVDGTHRFGERARRARPVGQAGESALRLDDGDEVGLQVQRRITHDTCCCSPIQWR